MTLVLVRHGETVWHAANRYAGSSDIALTDRGFEQARRLGDWAATAGLSAAVSSPLVRARDTVGPAARAAGLRPSTDPRLIELHFGDGEGRTAAQMRQAFPAARAAFEQNPIEHPLPGGEDPNAAIERATACLRDLARRHRDARVLVVWHSTIMRLTLCHLLGIDPRGYRSVFPTVRNVGITEIDLTEHHCALLQFNTLPTLPSPNPHPG